MTSNVLCKYYMNGACAYGDQCRFSHSKQDEPTQVCKYYLQGNCAYGDRCRYHHSKPSWSGRGQTAPPSNYNAPTGVYKPAAGPAPAPAGAAAAGGAPNWDEFMTPDEMDEFEQWQEEQQMASPTKGGGAGGGGDEGDIVDPADIPLCQEYAATGQCSAGDDCLYIHGEECEFCHQRVLNPANPQAAVQHKTLCSRLAANIAKRLKDSQIECGICLEKILSKRELSQRRFGLMSCDHAFCLGCIRNWRSSAEVDKNTALRTCPICRTTTHFITPSTKWPDSPEEKEAIIDAYKAAMAEKDCVNFDFGDGRCPFGTSCFYKHAYRDGTLEEVQLQRAANADGDLRVLGPVKLSSFLESSLTAQITLSRRPQQRRRQQQQQPGASGNSSGGAAADEAAAGLAGLQL